MTVEIHARNQIDEERAEKILRELLESVQNPFEIDISSVYDEKRMYELLRSNLLTFILESDNDDPENVWDIISNERFIPEKSPEYIKLKDMLSQRLNGRPSSIVLDSGMLQQDSILREVKLRIEKEQNRDNLKKEIRARLLG